MKFDHSNKFDLCYYGQVNSLRLTSSVASKWASKHIGGNIYFAGDGSWQGLEKVGESAYPDPEKKGSKGGETEKVISGVQGPVCLQQKLQQ